MTRRSGLIVSGMTITHGYPFTAAISESAIPVFPLVGSTIVDFPGTRSPAASAASIMARPIRILDAVSRVRRLEFAQNRGAAIADDSVQPNQRGAADQVGYGICDLHVGPSSFGDDVRR